MHAPEQEPLKLRASRSARTVWKASLGRFMSTDNIRRIAPQPMSVKSTGKLAATRRAMDCLFARRKDIPPMPADYSISASTLDSFLTCATSTDSFSCSGFQLRKAVTWLGKPFVRSLTMPPHFLVSEPTEKTSVDEPEIECASPISSSSLGCYSRQTYQGAASAACLLVPPSFMDKHKVLHCKVESIANLAASHEHVFELDIRVDNVSQTHVCGVMRKKTKNSASSSGPMHPFTFPVKETFELSFVVTASRPRPFLRDLIRVLPRKRVDTSGVVVGVARLSSFDNPQLSRTEKTVCCYRLANPDRIKGWDIEITVELELKDPPGCMSNWQLPLHISPALSDPHMDHVEPDDLAIAQLHCERGDYLTIYARSQGFPTWERYWVTLVDGRLRLQKYTYKEHKEPTDEIHLAHLQRVRKPSGEEEDAMCLGRKHGLVLHFDPTVARVVQPVRVEQYEQLEGKMFVFADNANHALHWQRALWHQAQTCDGETAHGVNLRFLW